MNGFICLLPTVRQYETLFYSPILFGNALLVALNLELGQEFNLEPASVRNLVPGNYTAIVRGVNNATGVVLVEVYALN